MGHDPKRGDPARDDITDTIPGLVTRSAGTTGPLIPSSLAEGSARTLPDGSSVELPEEKQTGVVGVTAGRSGAKEGEALDTTRGSAPVPPRPPCRGAAG